MRLFAKCLLLIVVVLGTVSAQNASKRGLVGRLKNTAIAEGCGCYFQYRGTPRNERYYLFFSPVEDAEKAAWMNIEERDVKLYAVSYFAIALTSWVPIPYLLIRSLGVSEGGATNWATAF